MKGLVMTQTLIISPALTAESMGSGLLPVYATPAVVALMENTACLCIKDLADEDTTVGIHIDVQHLKAAKVGEKVTCTAEMTRTEGRHYTFAIEVKNAKGETLATATHERVRVNKSRFMEKV